MTHLTSHWSHRQQLEKKHPLVSCTSLDINTNAHPIDANKRKTFWVSLPPQSIWTPSEAHHIMIQSHTVQIRGEACGFLCLIGVREDIRRFFLEFILLFQATLRSCVQIPCVSFLGLLDICTIKRFWLLGFWREPRESCPLEEVVAVSGSLDFASRFSASKPYWKIPLFRIYVLSGS